MLLKGFCKLQRCLILATHLLVVKYVNDGNMLPENGATRKIIPLRTFRPNGNGFKNKNSSSYFESFLSPDVKNFVLIASGNSAIITPFDN